MSFPSPPQSSALIFANNASTGDKCRNDSRGAQRNGRAIGADNRSANHLPERVVCALIEFTSRDL